MNDNQLRCWLVQAGFRASDVLQTGVNKALPNGTTPLMHAARTGDIEALKGLLARGAAPSVMNADGNAVGRQEFRQRPRGSGSTMWHRPAKANGCMSSRTNR